MMRGLVGRKIGMTRIFDERGDAIHVTLLEAGPCVVKQIKTNTTDGYEAIQGGYKDRKEKHTNKPLQGHFDKALVSPKAILAEFQRSQVLIIKMVRYLTLIYSKSVNTLRLQVILKVMDFLV